MLIFHLICHLICHLTDYSTYHLFHLFHLFHLYDLCNHLKENYDYIVLDTPPIQPVSDTLFIGQATDHNLLIARSKFTKLAGIRSAVKKLKNVNVNVDGLVFNDLDTSKASYYGYYQYGGYYRKYKSYT